MLAIERFSLDLDGITVLEPDMPVHEDGQVLGLVPEELRPVWSLLQELHKSHGAYHEKLDYGQRAVEHEDADDAHAHMKVHAAMLYIKSFFGERLIRELELGSEYDSYSICKGWVVVGKVQEPFPSLGFLFEGGGILDLLSSRYRN